MRAIPCLVIRRRLAAFHDGQLSVADRVAVADHLQECAACAYEVADIAAVSHDLRRGVTFAASDDVDWASMSDGILSRVQAEQNVSWSVRLRDAFDDMHFVWAGLSATAATLGCAAVLFAIWMFAPPERADSLAGTLSAMANPGSDRNPVSLNVVMSPPRVGESVLPARLASNISEQDLVFALAAVVTREGRVSRSQVLLTNHPDQDVLLLTDAIRQARLQPASLSGTPVAVNMVWLFAQTTVRPTKIRG